MVKKTVFMLCGLLLFVTFSRAEENREEERLSPLEIYQYLQRDIQSVHLLRALSLRKEQIEFVMLRAKMARIMEELYKFRTKELLLPLNAALVNIKKAVTAKENVPPELTENVQSLQKELETVTSNYEKKRLELAEEIKQQLDGNQLYIIDCFFSGDPLDIHNTQTEQESVSEEIKKLLAAVRMLPQKKYEKRKLKLAQAVIEENRKKLPDNYIIDEEKEAQRLFLFFAEARSMKEADFDASRQEFLEAFKSKYVIPKTSAEITKKIERFLLHENSISLLKAL